MRRMFALIVSAALLFALCACGTQEELSVTSSPAGSEEPEASPPQSPAPFEEADALVAVGALTGSDALRVEGKRTYVTEEFYVISPEAPAEGEPSAYLVTLDGEKIFARFDSANMEGITVSALYEVAPVDVMEELGPALDAFGWFQFGLSEGQDIRTLDALRERLSSIFSQEIVDTLMAQNAFLETENGLEPVGGRGSDATLGNAIIEMTRSTDTERTYQVTAEYLDTSGAYQVEESRVFTYVQTLQDGTWLFTTFPELYY